LETVAGVDVFVVTEKWGEVIPEGRGGCWCDGAGVGSERVGCGLAVDGSDFWDFLLCIARMGNQRKSVKQNVQVTQG
jgi:hypothetical protein